jgi:hypothetical protein
MRISSQEIVSKEQEHKNGKSSAPYYDKRCRFGRRSIPDRFHSVIRVARSAFSASRFQNEIVDRNSALIALT